MNLFSRFITIMTYMNDVEQGGETAFVNADNSTHDSNVSVFNQIRNTNVIHLVTNYTA